MVIGKVEYDEALGEGFIQFNNKIERLFSDNVIEVDVITDLLSQLTEGLNTRLNDSDYTIRVKWEFCKPSEV
jgi:hypothetical protein